MFKTKHKGWGVRCAATLVPGAFVAAYLGKLDFDKAADGHGNDLYLFDLDHFHIVREQLRETLERVDCELAQL